MKVHLLEREQHVPAPPEEVFAFFADALNLETITPPWLNFRVLTPAPIEMRPGALIEYRLALHRLPVRWLTRIEEWTPGRGFVDAQVRGPYRLWHHTHTFARPRRRHAGWRQGALRPPATAARRARAAVRAPRPRADIRLSPRGDRAVLHKVK